VRCNYCSKTFIRGIFRFKHHLVGIRYDSEPCVSIPEEISFNVESCFNAKDASLKKRRLNSLEKIYGGEESEQTFSSSKIFFKNLEIVFKLL